MNKQCFRVIFSKTLQRLVVVSELAKSEGKASESSSSGQILQKICKMRPLVFSLFCALGFVAFSENALAETLIIQADKSAPKNQQPIVLQTANGLPQVNIQTPNDKGLSHNKYSQFDVTEKGAILNNSRTHTQTQQAGLIQGNPYLARGEAKVILNEVNSNKPSVMKGYVEVAGKKADVIIANPSGLHCEGCGIINSDRATFTTGKPEIKNGQVDNFKVEAGKVKVSGKGLDNSRVDYTEILAREAEVNAGIWSKKETNVITGKNTIKRSENDKNLQIISTKQPLAGEVKPQVAIDVGELGGMYSGKIHLIGTENGVGVRNAGHIGASAETLQIDSQGRIVNTGTLNAANPVTLTASKGIDNKGKIENKQGDIQLKSQTDIQNSGSIVARGGDIQKKAETTIHQSGETVAKENVNYTANKVEATTTSLIAAGIEVKDTAQGEARTQEKRSANGKNITVKATEKATLQGRNLAPNQISATAKTANVDNSQNSAKDIKLSAEQGDLSANKAEFEAETLTFSTPKTLSTQGGYLSANHIHTTQNALNNDGGTWLQKGVEALRLSMNGTLKNNGGTFYTPNDFYLNSGHIEHTQGHFLAGKNLTISAQNINATAGKMVAGQSLSVNAKDFINDHGFIQAAGNLHLTLSERFTNRQTNGENQGVFAFGKLQLNASQFDNTQGVLFTPNTAQFTLDKWTNTQGLAQSNQGFSIQTKQLNNDVGRIITAQHLQLNAGEVVSQQQGRIGAKTLDLQAGRLRSMEGSVISSDTADIRILGFAENRESVIDTVQNLNFTSSGLDNMQGKIRSQQAALHLDTQKQQLDNSKGSLRAATGITLHSGALINDRGAIQTEKDLRIDTHQKKLSNRQTLSSDKGIVALGNLSLNVGDVDNTQGYLATQQHLSLIGKSITNDSGLLKAGDSLSLSAVDLQNHQGLVHSKNQADFILQQSLVQQGGEINTKRLNLSAVDMASDNGSLISAVEMVINLSGNLSNQHSRIQSQNDLTIQSGQVNNQQGVLIGNEQLSLQTGKLLNQNGVISAKYLTAKSRELAQQNGVIQGGQQAVLMIAENANSTQHSQILGGTLNITVQGHFNNQQSEVRALTGNLTLQSKGLTNTQGIIASDKGDFILNTQQQSLNNEQGTISSGANLTVSTGDIDNRLGLIHSQEKMVIDTHQGSLDNRNTQTATQQGLLALGEMQLNTQSLNNQNGKIITNLTQTIQAKKLDNQQGKITALDSQKLSIADHLDNRAGQIAVSNASDIQATQLNNSQKGIIQADSLYLAAALINQQGRIITKADQDLQLREANNEQGVIKSILGSVQLVTNSTLNNNAGEILAKNRANLTAYSMDNRDGMIYAETDRLTLNISSAINNQNGTLHTLNQLEVGSKQLNNQQGSIFAGNLARITSNVVENQGNITSNGKLTLTSQTLNNSQGKIRSQDNFILTANTNLNNQAGLLESSKLLQISTPSLNNQNTKSDEKAPTSGIVGSSLIVNSKMLNNAQGGIYSRILGQLNLTELDNKQGEIHSQGDLFIRGEKLAINNQDGYLQANQKLDLNAERLSNDGDLTADDLQIRLKQDFTTGKHIHANSHLLLETQGTLTNNHQLYADQSVTLVAQDFTNQQNGRVSSENTTINVTNTVDNSGLINAITSIGEMANTVIRANQIINKNRIYGDHVALQADRIINQDDATSAPVIAARERLDLAAREIENNADHYQGDGQVGSLLFSGGDIVFGRQLDENNKAVGEADTLRNISSTIEAEGDIALNVNQVKNINKHYDAIHFISNQTGTDETLVNITTLNEGYLINAQGNDRGLDDSKYFKKDRNTQTSSISTHSGFTPLSEVEWVPYSRAGRYQWRADRVEPTLIEKDTVITEDMLLAGFHDTLCENGKCQAVQAGLYPKDSPIWAYFGIPAPETDAPTIPSIEKPSSWYIESKDPEQPDIENLPTKPTEPIQPEKANYQVKDSKTGKTVLDEAAYQVAVNEYEQLLQEYNQQLKEYQFYEQEFKPYDDWVNENKDSIDKLEAKIQEHNEKWTEKHSYSPKYYNWFWKIYLNEQREDESKIKQSAPAQILSGGNIVGNSQHITNDKSNIIAGGTLALKDKVTNIDDKNGLHRLTFSGTSQFSRSRWRGGLRRYFQRDWHDVIDYERVIETPFNMGVYRMDENTQSSKQYKPDDISTHKTDTQSKTDYQLSASNFAQGNAYQLDNSPDEKGISDSLDSDSLLNVGKNKLNPFSAEHTNAENVNALLSENAATRAGIDTNLNPTKPNSESANARRLQHFSLNPQQEVRTITPNLQLPNNRIYRLNSTPSSTVLVETDPDFTNQKRWLSSDYMFNALRVEPNQAQKRLGDGFYEQRLVREQINRLTGRQFLGNYSDFDSQYRALMNAGVTFAEKFNLRVGIALSPEQVANLTSDIVWLESETVTLPNGEVEQVLVPKVYALAQKGDITGKGALLSGNQVSHSGGELINSGTIAGRELIQLDSQSVKNRGTISAGVLSGNVTGDLENLGGTLEADRAILLNVTGNITHGSTLHTTEVNNNGYQRSETTVGRKGLIHVKGEDGVLQLQSGGNFTVSGADIINNGQGQTYLSANGSFALNALQTGFDEKMGGGNHYRNQSVNDVVISRIKGNGDVTLSSKDIYSQGADFDAKARLALLAENDVVLSSASTSSDYTEYHHTKSGGGLGSSKKTSLDTAQSRTQVGTKLGGENIIVSAGNDLTAQNLQAIADNDLHLQAGNNVKISADTNYVKETHFEHKSKSGVFSGGGIGITFGKKSETHESELEGWQQSQARSTLGSLSGNITVKAGNHAHISGTDLIASKALDKQILVEGKSTYIGASQDDLHSKERHEYKQSGLTLSFSSAVTDGVMAVNQSLQRSGEVKDERLSQLLKVKAANEAYETAQKAAKVIDALNSTDNLSDKLANSDAKISVSIGSSKSVSTSHTQQTTHKGSELDAGKVIVRATEGDNTIAGSKINATRTELEGNNVNLLGTTDTQTNRSDNKSSSWSVAVFVGKSQESSGLGVEGAVNVGKGHSNSDSRVQNQTEINSDSLSIKTKETTTLKDAVANINHLALETKNLHIESVQNTEIYESKQTQGGISGSAALGGGNASAQFSQNKAKVDYAQVARQSGFNITESSKINVEENTHIDGGIIHAQGDKANHRMTTGTLTTADIENRSDVKVSSVSAGASTDISKMATMAVGAALSALGNMSESERSHTKAAISSNINLSITDSEKQKALTGKTAEETLQSLNRDTANANQAVEKADLSAIQEKQETAQVIGELSQSWINRLVQPHLEEANKKRQEAEKIEKSDPLKSAQLKAEAQAIEAEYGLGSNLQMGVRAATAALQGVATGNTNQAAVGLFSPYANKLIKDQTTNADGSINKEANLMAHAVLGALEAHITGNNAAAGALGAFTAEAAAPYLMQAMYGTDKPAELTESQKQNIANLSQIAAGLASGVTGDSTADFVSGAEIGKRAVENNYLTKQEAERKRALDEKAKADTITTEEELERNAIAKKDIETDLALISVCEENRLSTQCQTERQKLEQAKFSYSGAEYTPTGYNYPTYTRYSDMYSDDYGKVATFSDRYDVLKNAKAKADSNFHNATGIDPSWFGRVDVVNNVVASIAGTRLATTEPSKATQVMPKSVSANEKLPVVGKSTGYEEQVTRISNPYSPYLEIDKYGNEIYYRTLSTRDYKILQDTGVIPPTSETFISPLAAYSRQYEGVLVKFTTKPGTSLSLQDIGVAGNSATKRLVFPDMPRANKGWINNDKAQFKLEGTNKPDINNGYGVVNTGLGKSEALYRFNENIIKFETIEK